MSGALSYNMSTKLITAPSVEPVSLPEAKDWARIDISDDDNLIKALITTARNLSETFTRRSFINTTWRYAMDCFPYGKVIDLPWSPLSSVTNLKYYDTAGVQQTFNSSLYYLDKETEPGRLILNPNEVWPSIESERYSAVTVDYVAGYGATADLVPEDIKTAIKMLVAHWYDVRPSVSMENLKDVPLAYESLLWQYKVHRFHT